MVREKTKRDEILMELKAALIDEQECLVGMEAEIDERKKAIGNLLRKIKNYG